MLEGGGGSVKGAPKGGTVGEPVFTEPRFKIIADAMGAVPAASAALGAPLDSRRTSCRVALFGDDEHTAQVLIGGPLWLHERSA